MSLLDRKGLRFTFFDGTREGEEHTLLFYERDPAGRGLDLDDNREDKPDFVKYAVKLRCLTTVINTKKTPLPPQEYLAEAVTIFFKVGLQHNNTHVIEEFHEDSV